MMLRCCLFFQIARAVALPGEPKRDDLESRENIMNDQRSVSTAVRVACGGHTRSGRSASACTRKQNRLEAGDPGRGLAQSSGHAPQ